MRKGFYLQENHLYLSIGNNKDNITVVQFQTYEQVGKNEFALFKDIVTGELCYCFGAKLAYTEKRFATLSKLSFDEVVELFFTREFPYEYEFNKAGDIGKDEFYIDPMVNFEKYASVAREIISKNPELKG